MVWPAAIVTRFLAPLAASRKSDRQGVGHVGAARARPRALATPAEQVAEEAVQLLVVAEALLGIVAAGRRVLGEVAIIVLLRPLLATGVDLAAIEAAALLGVGQKVIGRRDALEALLDIRLARIEVGMQLLGELAVRLLDRVLAVGLGDPQHRVGIVAHSGSIVRRGPVMSTTSRPILVRSTVNWRSPLPVHGTGW